MPAPVAEEIRSLPRSDERRSPHPGLPFKPLAEVDSALETAAGPYQYFVDVPATRHDISFWVTRVRSKNGITKNQLAKLKCLQIAGKRQRVRTHPLNRSAAGQLNGVQWLIDTGVVLPRGNNVRAAPHEIIQIAKEEPTVKPSVYEVDGSPAVSLDWSTGEHSRVEQFETFKLFAWTCRLSAGEAIRMMIASAEPEATIHVLAFGDELLSRAVGDFDRRYVDSRADRVRLLRLETKDSTFLWEIAGARSAGDPDFVVMIEDARSETIAELIERTGQLRITLAEDQILGLARGIGAL